VAAELGQTSDPHALIPGDTGQVTTTQQALTDYGDLLQTTGEGLAKIDTEAGWSGQAGDQFREKFHGKPEKWTAAAGYFHGTAGALVTYVGKLTWAQQEAADAIVLWNQGEAATTAAKTQHDTAVRKAQADAAAKTKAGTPTTAPTIPFVDAGEVKRQAARDKLNHARTELQHAGDTAEHIVDAGRDKAPHKPGFWSHVGHFFSGVGNTLENAGIDLVNATASLGNAMITHPGDLALTLAGLGLTAVSAAGDGLGGLMDATVVLSPFGVALNVVSTAGVVAGVGMAGTGVMNMSKDAAENPVEAVSRGGDGGGGASGGGVGGSGDPAGDLKFARRIKIDSNNPAVSNRGMTVQDFIGKFRNGEVNRKFPGEFKDQTVEEALKSGNSTVRKLLTDGRWKTQ